MQSEGRVVGDQRGSKTVVLLQPLLQHLGVVVVPPDQRLPGDIIFAGYSWWVELLVIGPTTCKVKPPTTDSSH